MKRWCAMIPIRFIHVMRLFARETKIASARSQSQEQERTERKQTNAKYQIFRVEINAVLAKRAALP